MKQITKLYKVAKFSTIREMLALAELEVPERYAFKYKTGEKNENGEPVVRCITYREFINDTQALGTALYERGLHGGVHIACMGENSYNWVCTYVSTIAGDNIFVPVDKDLPADEMLNVLSRSDSTVAFVTAKFEKFINEHSSELPNIKHIFRIDDDSFTSLLDEGRKALENGKRGYLDSHSDVNSLKMLVYTSGTTGVSKGVMLSEHNICSCVFGGLSISRLYTVGLSVLPYHHTYESVVSLLGSLHNHATICINESVRAVLQNFKLYQPDYLCVVPALAEMFYKRIWRTAEDNGKDKQLKMLISLSNGLRKIGIDLRKKFFKTIHDTFGGKLYKMLCGGAPIRPEVAQFFNDIGINLVIGYGITECSPLVAGNSEDWNTTDTVGIKVPCVDVKIDEPDEFGNGEICVKGDIVMLGYYKDPVRTAEVLSPDGWFRTGDFGNINAEGNIAITGRKKNIIVLKNGKNIYPEEIENYIMQIPYVSEVVVYSTLDNDGNQSGLCAEAFLDSAKVEELKIENPLKQFRSDVFHTLKELPVYKQVSTVLLRTSEFEKTSTKKIKRALVGKSNAVASI